MTPPSFAEIVVEGADAGSFLHSQLANDVRSVDVGQWRYGSYCVPDGRVQALLMIARPGAEHFRLLLPSDVTAGVVSRLQRFRLRSRCTITTDSIGFAVPEETSPMPARYQSPAFTLGVNAGGDQPMPVALWRQQLDLGIPWILAATSERFLPQVLGLERLQAFSLRKGCFPGQEVVARTHFLGRVKRRLVRLSATTAETASQPGADLCLVPGGAASATVLLSGCGGDARTLAVVGEDAQPGGILSAANPNETATYVIERDVIETLSDEVLNGRYYPPFSA